MKRFKKAGIVQNIHFSIISDRALRNRLSPALLRELHEFFAVHTDLRTADINRYTERMNSQKVLPNIEKKGNLRENRGDGNYAFNRITDPFSDVMLVRN